MSNANFQLKLLYGKRREVRLPLENLKIDLRKLVKNALRLQVPFKYITIKKLANNGVFGHTVDNSSSSILEYKPEFHREFLSFLKPNDTLRVGVMEFDLGNCICSGDELGSGSFSQVYKGRLTQPIGGAPVGTVVAIKVVDAKLLESEKAKEYHEREKQIIKQLSHPNIVAFYDIVAKDEGVDGEYFYFVMEFCQGGSLDAHIHQKPMAENLARRFTAQLASALQYLIEKNIIHRDLKPQNILLSSSNLEEASLKLCDFGFSRFYNSENALIQSFPYTPLYAAPDLIHHNPYDNKSDLWSVGAILYEMLVGAPLFKVNNFVELENALKQKEHIDIPNHIYQTLSRDCIELLYGLLEKDSKKRIQWQQFFSHPFITPKAPAPRPDPQRMRSGSNNSLPTSPQAPSSPAPNTAPNTKSPPASPAAKPNAPPVTIRLYCVPTGEEYEVAINDNPSIGSFKIALSPHHKIPRENQFICTESGQEVPDDVLVNTVTKATNKNLLYLYNKEDTVPSQRTQPQAFPVTLPLIPFHINEPDPHLKELYKYLHNFHVLAENQKAYYKSSELALNGHKAALPVLQIQAKGLRVAVYCIQELQTRVTAEFESMTHMYQSQRIKVQQILDQFQSTLEKLSGTELLLPLRANNRKYLIDCIDKAGAQDKFRKFRQLNDDFKTWLNSIDSTLKAIDAFRLSTSLLRDTSVNQNADNTKPEDPFQCVALFNRSKEHFKEIEIGMQTFQYDLTKVTREIEKAKRIIKQSPTIKNDLVQAFEEMWEHDNYQAKKTHDYYEDINKNMMQAIQYKDNVYIAIQNIFLLKKKCEEVLKEAATRQNQLLERQELIQDLVKILNLPDAYTSYVQEMSRRFMFQETLKNKASKAKEWFEKQVAEENARLQTFVNTDAIKSLNPDIFLGATSTEQAPISISAPEITVISLNDSSVKNHLIGSDFDAIFSEEVDVAEVRRQNVRLLAELAEKNKELKQNGTMELLQEIKTLKQKVSDVQHLRDKVFQDYEARLDEYKKKWNEADVKSQKLGEAVSEMEQQLKTSSQNEDKVAQLEAQLSKEREDNAQLLSTIDKMGEQMKQKTQASEQAMAALQAKLKSMSDAMVTLQKQILEKSKDDSSKVQSAQQTERILQLEMAIKQMQESAALAEQFFRQDLAEVRQASENEKAEAVKRVQELNLRVHELEHTLQHAQEEQAKIQAQQRERDQAIEHELNDFKKLQGLYASLKTKYEDVEKKYEAAKKKANQTECPLCGKLFPNGEIQAHVNRCVPQD